MGKTYRASSPGDVGGWSGVIVNVVDDDGRVTPLTHHKRHSPTGFSWGYEGSGPAELARCLLIDALGDRAKCGSCSGFGRVEYRDDEGVEFVPVSPTFVLDESEITDCPDCWGSGVSPLVERNYQTFKRERVATVRAFDAFEITDVEIMQWLDAHPIEATT